MFARLKVTPVLETGLVTRNIPVFATSSNLRLIVEVSCCELFFWEISNKCIFLLFGFISYVT